jgi:hypothetical protein
MLQTGNTWEVKGSYKRWWKCVPLQAKCLTNSVLSFMLQTDNTWEVKGSYKRWWKCVPLQAKCVTNSVLSLYDTDGQHVGGEGELQALGKVCFPYRQNV